MRILLIQGSPRHLHNSPREWPKTTFAINEVYRKFHEHVELDIVDLSVPRNARLVQPCKGCVATAGGLHCHWPCSCYGPGSIDDDVPDVMWNERVYRRLEAADGFILFAPIHWYAVPTQVKAMFDRLVCANLTLTRRQAVELLRPSNGSETESTGARLPDYVKDPNVTKAAARSGRFDSYLRNHLAGRIAGFFIYGDAGADDYVDVPAPMSYRQAVRDREPGPICAIRPLVWQCRYSGIVVPDDCIEAFNASEGIDYADQNERVGRNRAFLDRAVMLFERLLNHIRLRKV